MHSPVFQNPGAGSFAVPTIGLADSSYGTHIEPTSALL
jgi:hypothetical protein